MPDEVLLTIRQIADQLQLPESTVRYYRDGFLDCIPSVGTGKRRRYPQQALAVLRTIARGYAEGRSRREIASSLEGNHDVTADVRGRRAVPARTVDGISNLELLAAIIDGEREQREALWQMAREVVRLTAVLEGQDRVLGEIAERAGVEVSGRLGAGGQAPAPALAPPRAELEPSAPGLEPRAVSPPRPPAAVSADLERLRAELEAERELVERLRESKLRLEHRAADAEAQLAEQKNLPSAIRRIFGGNP